ncbi:hypothetical protein [uncultured Dokdonia sp.]|uniref:hypothetical protein n=1 Tax=uncultured Dokdonia sp. TaxID=575653 RepID=UPI00261A911B|nr:hypothetical protein [uncultured Dokdonia sp.]
MRSIYETDIFSDVAFANLSDGRQERTKPEWHFFCKIINVLRDHDLNEEDV